MSVTKNKHVVGQNFSKEPALRQANKKRRAFIMASRSSNRAEVPEAKEALDRFKMEVAQELGVPLSNGYNKSCQSLKII